MSRYTSLCWCAMLLVATCLTTIRADDHERLHIQVVHNHGVRLPITSHNQTDICLKRSCGELDESKAKAIHNMATTLRKFILSQDNKEFNAIMAAKKFNATMMHSRSTDETRTLQSSSNFFSALLSTEIPLTITHTTDLKTDTLLNTKASPAVYFQYKYGMPEIRAVCNPLMNTSGLSFDVLQEIAKEVHSEGYCNDTAKGVDCAMLLCDIGTSYDAELALMDSYRSLNEHLNQLCNVAACVSNFTLGYNKNNSLNLFQGSKGQVLAQEILTNMNNHLSNKSEVIFHEYSANGDVITSLASTLDIHSQLSLIPPFGMSFVFFLRTLNGISKVHLFMLIPETETSFNTWQIVQLPEKIFTSFNDLVSYTASYSMENFTTLINSSAPKKKEGLCYLDSALKKRMNCAVSAKEGTPNPMEEDCLFYQKQCSTFVSEKGYRLSLPNYAYYPTTNLTVITNIIGLSLSAIVVICIATFMFGMLLGLFVFYIRMRCNAPPKSDYPKFDSA